MASGGGRGRRKGAQPPHHDADRHDDRAGGLEEREALVARRDERVPQRRHLVRRQLEDHRPRGALHERPPQHGRADERRHRAEEVARRERHGGVERLADEQHARQEHVDRQPRRAAHERRDEDRREPIAAIRNQPGRHDPGQRAGVAREQRHERVAGQAEAAEQPVHHERGAREIAGVLEQADEEEQQADLRQEHHRARDAADDPVGR